MDINKLLHRHQLAKLKAQHAPSRQDRATNCELVGRYAERITAWRTAEGLPGAGWPQNDGSCCLAIA
jgi:ribosome-binding protein aMBF1 (putative translation factor)